MRVLRAIGRWFWRFMVIFSFIVNLILLIVLAGLLILIFDIKHNIATPLVTGLHSSFVGLNNATIDWTIPVRANVPVNLDIALKQDTIVTLTEAVPLTVVAQIVAPGLTVNNATVYLSLPAGLELPVALDVPVEVRDTLPVALDVRAVIPLQNTQLHDVAENLRLLFEPLAVGLTNLPDDFGEAFTMIGDTLRGNAPNLLAANEYSQNPWPGFSMTAGLNYPPELLTAPVPQENVTVQTGIVPLGGIPLLDEQTRPDVYTQGGPFAVNEQARANAQVPAYFFDGQFWQYRLSMLSGQPMGGSQSGTNTDNGNGSTTTDPLVPTPTPWFDDQGIVPTPTGN